MENFNEGGEVHISKIIYPPNNRDNDSYEDCEDQVEFKFEENLRLAKIFSKVIRKLDERSGNNVPTNVKNIPYTEKDGEIQNLKYSYKCKGIKCLKCKDFGHIQVERSSFP